MGRSRLRRQVPPRPPTPCPRYAPAPLTVLQLRGDLGLAGYPPHRVPLPVDGREGVPALHTAQRVRLVLGGCPERCLRCLAAGSLMLLPGSKEGARARA